MQNWHIHEQGKADRLDRVLEGGPDVPGTSAKGDRLWAAFGPARGPSPGRKDHEGVWWWGRFEIVDNHAGDTYRAVYTVRFGDKICVLHTFQKKSKKGIRTPKPDIAMVKARFK